MKKDEHSVNGSCGKELSGSFYTKVFTYGRSRLTRGMLETLPVPFDTSGITDSDMCNLVKTTELAVRRFLKLPDGEEIDLCKPSHHSAWWMVMEDVAVWQDIPYRMDYD